MKISFDEWRRSLRKMLLRFFICEKRGVSQGGQLTTMMQEFINEVEAEA